MGASVVAPTAPTCTAPAEGADVYDGVSVTVSATVTAGEVPDRIDWVLDPGVSEVVVATDSTSPYSTTWTPSGVTAGAHTLVARFVYGSGSVDSAAVNIVLFDPSVLSGLKLWLDAQDADSLTLSGANVTAWANGGDAVHLASVDGTGHAPQYSATAINSLPGLDFNGTSQYLVGTYAAPLAQPMTTFIVMSSDVPGADTGVVLDGTTVGGRHVCDVLGATSRAVEIYAGAAVTSAGAKFTNGTPFVYEATFDGASSSILVDGVSAITGDCGAQSAAGVTIGNRYALDAFWFNGQIGEIVEYDSNLSAGNQTRVRDYLTARWGI